MKTRLVRLALTMGILSIGGCTHARSPEPVPLDRVECARCRMLISSEAGGGEIVSRSAETRFYDDIACLAADWTQHADGATAFVRLTDGRWSNAGDASFAQPTGTRTAMGSGFAAFSTIAEARAADRAGRVLTFDEVVRLSGEAR